MTLFQTLDALNEIETIIRAKAIEHRNQAKAEPDDAPTHLADAQTLFRSANDCQTARGHLQRFFDQPF